MLYLFVINLFDRFKNKLLMRLFKLMRLIYVVYWKLTTEINYDIPNNEIFYLINSWSFYD